MESGRNTLQVVGAACLGSLISVDQEQDRCPSHAHRVSAQYIGLMRITDLIDFSPFRFSTQRYISLKTWPNIPVTSLGSLSNC